MRARERRSIQFECQVLIVQLLQYTISVNHTKYTVNAIMIKCKCYANPNHFDFIDFPEQEVVHQNPLLVFVEAKEVFF